MIHELNIKLPTQCMRKATWRPQNLPDKEDTTFRGALRKSILCPGLCSVPDTAEISDGFRGDHAMGFQLSRNAGTQRETSSGGRLVDLRILWSRTKHITCVLTQDLTRKCPSFPERAHCGCLFWCWTPWHWVAFSELRACLLDQCPQNRICLGPGFQWHLPN